MTFSPQIYSQMVTASFLRRPGGNCANGSLFVINPACGVTIFDPAKANTPAQSPRIIAPTTGIRMTWQSSIGFQKQINTVTGFEADVTHCNGYRDTRTIDPNLFYNPATGYNLNPAAINGLPNRPNPAYTQIAYFVSDGYAGPDAVVDGAQSSSAGTTSRRRHLHLHVRCTTTATSATRRPGRTTRSTTATASTPRRTTSSAHRAAARPLSCPWGISTSVSYAYGSGERFAAASRPRRTENPAPTV